jgi:hypothetical protein
MAGLLALVAFVTAILTALNLPGCAQNQENSPISISHSSGRMLAVACSTDGTVAYVSDGRNIYRYDRRAPAGASSWECILSQGERLELATRHDPREPLPSPATGDQPGGSRQPVERTENKK